MSKKPRDGDARPRAAAVMIPKKHYKHTLHKLQVELVKLQRHFIKCDDKILIIFEGRDAAGKDGTIKRIIQHLSPRETRVVALGKPSDPDFQHDVLRRAFALLDADHGPVLVDHPVTIIADDTAVSCTLPPRFDPTLAPAVDEANGLRRAYDRSRQRRGVTSVGRVVDAMEAGRTEHGPGGGHRFVRERRIEQCLGHDCA